MKTHILILFVLLSVIGYTQNGINYKALIKDASGNTIANTTIQIQFTIVQDVTNVYIETHSPTTDTNGIVIVNIGEGTATSGDFNTINWEQENHSLNVQIDTGNGLVDLGTTQFMSVPYAKHAKTAGNVSGLEVINEGNGIGRRLIGKNPNNYGNIGFLATDLSHSDVASSTLGATGNNTTALGLKTRANGDFSTAMGRLTEASGESSTAMGIITIASGENSIAMGNHSEASGVTSTAIGFETEASGNISLASGNYTTASGIYSTAIGNHTRARAFNSTAIGRYNVGNGNTETWNGSDPLFEIGNGTSEGNRNNALRVNKNGSHIIKSSAIGLSIETESVGLYIYNSGDTGVVVNNSEEHGGVFEGKGSGIKIRSSIVGNPDIILAGNSSANNSDDGIITSDTFYPSSDIYLKSNDDVVIELDDNNNESGVFRIRNSEDTDVFAVNESGTVRVNGTIVHSSDKRLKRDIENIEFGLNEVLQLTPKQYFWKNNDHQEVKSLGLIAQDVQSIIKNIVLEGDDDMKTLSVSYTELIPVLIKAIQEQQEIIGNQNTKIEGLASELTALESMNTRIIALEQKLKTATQ